MRVRRESGFVHTVAKFGMGPSSPPLTWATASVSNFDHILIFSFRSIISAIHIPQFQSSTMFTILLPHESSNLHYPLSTIYSILHPTSISSPPFPPFHFLSPIHRRSEKEAQQETSNAEGAFKSQVRPQPESTVPSWLL